ncbi:hypothetical protein SALBM217S_10395 [Streptomyces griseoloalbus]
MPLAAIVASVVFGFVAVFFNYKFPDSVFLFLVNFHGAVALFVWLVICFSQLRMRKIIQAEAPEKLVVRMWLYPYLTWRIRRADRLHPRLHAHRHGARRTQDRAAVAPQGYPLLVQAGSSEDGKRFAARYAEAVFTAQQTLADARSFYADLKARTAAAGRDPDHVKALPGIVPVVGSTEAEARRLEQVLDEHIVPEHGLRRLEELLRLDPGTLALDAELPGELPSEDEIEGAKSRYTLIVELALRERLTVRRLIARLGGGRH